MEPYPVGQLVYDSEDELPDLDHHSWRKFRSELVSLSVSFLSLSLSLSLDFLVQYVYILLSFRLVSDPHNSRSSRNSTRRKKIKEGRRAQGSAKG
jgi:hypothetical protein